MKPIKYNKCSCEDGALVLNSQTAYVCTGLYKNY